MTFADLLKGDSLFLDAKILVYHFEPHPTLGPARPGAGLPSSGDRLGAEI